MIFETDRLIIREMGLGDFCAICGILQDGETMCDADVERAGSA